jgi:GntR family transcriptional regulator
MPEERQQPKYVRMADELRAEIDTGIYGPGDRLPGENDLMARYGVARMTARNALAVLQAEGLTVARKGAGVFVREFRPIRRHSVERLHPAGWSAGSTIWDTDIEGRQLTVVDIEVYESEPPTAVSRILETGRCIVRSRTYVLDGKPVQLASSWLPADLVAGSHITDADPGPGGIYARLADLGHKPVRFREETRARMPLAEETRRLDLQAATPVIVIYRTAYTADDRAVEVNEMILDASAYVIENNITPEN